MMTSSEEDALQFIRNAALEEDQPFNLLIVDYRTPKDGGIEFFYRIKKLSLFKQPPKTMLMIPLAREDLYDDIEAARVDFGIYENLSYLLFCTTALLNCLKLNRRR